MRSKMTTLLLLGFSAFLLLMCIVVAVWRFGGRADKPATPKAEAQAGEMAPAEAMDAEPAEELSPAEQALRERDNPVLRAQSVPVDSGYFADAAFVVNSVSRGLDLYDYDVLLVKADFYGGEELSVYNTMDCIREMEGKNYGKIYLGLGIEEIGDDIEDIQASYESILSQLRTLAPESIVVLMSMPPVSEYKSSNDEYCNRELVVEYNEMLLKLAESWDVWYLDVYTVLANDEGYLPSEVNEDGIHFTPAHYAAWFERLSTHYVNDGTVVTPAATPAPTEEVLPEAEVIVESGGEVGN